MNLEYFVMPESKEVLKTHKEQGMSEGCRSQPGVSSNCPNCNNLRNKMSNIVLDYNPIYKINKGVHNDIHLSE